MPSRQTTGETHADIGPLLPADDERQVRQLAVRQLERKRRFRMHAASYAVVSILLMIIWAMSEYNNAGGWPTNGFSQSSSVPHVWNIWIIYPLLGLGVVAAVDAWNTFGKKAISESEIRREMGRLTGGHRQT
jgi:protein-S-isoprenylcysteine O-methyltransferase Ste14